MRRHRNHRARQVRRHRDLRSHRNPRYLGQHDALASPVISGGQAQVRHSFVQGREIVRDGKLPWLDMEQLAADANRIVARIASQVN